MPTRPGSVDRGTILALVLAAPLALATVVAWAPLRETLAPPPEPEPPAPRPKAKAPPKPKPADKATEKPKAAAPATGVEVAPPPRPALTAAERKELALAGCKRLAKAIEDYQTSDRNPGTTADERFPLDPNHLDKPPFGGPSFLPNGAADFFDPWGKPYQFQLRARADGTTYVLVFTLSPDATPISQFGMYEDSAPPK